MAIRDAQQIPGFSEKPGISSDLKKHTALILLVIIFLAGFFLRQYRLLDFPFYGDEVDGGEITLDFLSGHIAPFYAQGEGHEALYTFTMAPFFVILGDSVIASRMPSVAWSMVFIALMYVYGRVLFDSRRAGVMAAGLTASLWWSSVFGHLGLRVVTLMPVMIPALLGLVSGIKVVSDRRAQSLCILGGIFAGLAAYTYTAGRGFPAIVIAFIVYAAIFHRDMLRKRWRMFFVYLVLMVIVSVPLYAYLYTHPQDDYRIRDLAGLSWMAQGDWRGMISAVSDTLGMFTLRGESNWVYNIAGRPVFVGPEGWLFYIGVLLCLRRLRRPEYAMQLIVLAIMLAPSIVTEHPPSWTRSAGMLPALLITTVLPIEWAWEKITTTSIAFLRARISQIAYAIIVVALGISIFARTATDMLQVWIDNPGVYWMTLAFYDGAGKYVNQSPDTTPLNYVMDVYTDWREHNVQRVVQRKDVAMRYSVSTAFVFPNDARGNRFAFQIFGAPATALLETVLDLDHPIYVDARIDPQGQRPLRVYNVPRAQLDQHLARANAAPVFAPNTNTPLTTSIQVSDTLQFLGYEILNPNTPAGADLNVVTYWRVLRRPPMLAVFLHLVDSQQKVVAQFDGFEAVVNDLAPGDIVAQLHALSLPSSLAPGTYRFELGAYTRDDLQRLPLNIGGDYVWLQEWQTRSQK